MDILHASFVSLQDKGKSVQSNTRLEDVGWDDSGWTRAYGVYIIFGI